MKTTTTSKRARQTKPATKRAATTRRNINATTSSVPRQTSNGVSARRAERQGEQTPFEKMFEDMLKDIYWAEQQLVTALGEMAQAASTTELKEAFEDHQHQTQRHIRRLDRVFNTLGKEAEGKKCEAMEGLIKEGKKVKEETPESSMTRDAGLIISAQKVEHYEIAAYGSLVQVALTLGYDEAAMELEKTLSEEEDTDKLLTEIAETSVNPMADIEDSEMEESEVEEMSMEYQN